MKNMLISDIKQGMLILLISNEEYVNFTDIK